MYFEDLEVWKSARELTNRIYKITAEGGFAKDYGLRDQIRWAAVSIMSLNSRSIFVSHAFIAPIRN